MSKILDLSENRIAVYILMPLSFLYLFIFFNQGINTYDEGLTLYGASRILNGDIPYRDFWAIYSPAQFYVLAALFKLFGVSVIVARIWFTIIRFILVICVFLFARKFVSQKFALIAWLLLLIWLGSYQFYGSPMPSALLFSFLSSFCLLSFIIQRRKTWLLLCGLLVGVATLFRHDIGFYTFLSEILVITPFVFTNLAPKGASVPYRLLQFIKVESFYLLGMAIVLLPTLFYFIQVVPISDLVYDFVRFPLEVYPKVRALPYPAPIPDPVQFFSGIVSPLYYGTLTLNRLPFYSPILIYIITIIMLVVRIRKRSIDWRQMYIWGIIFFLLLGIAFFNHVRVRSDLSHLMATYIPAVILFAILLSNVPKIRKLRVVSWGLAFLLGFSFVGSSIYKTRHLIVYGIFSPLKLSFDLDRAKGIYGDQEWVTTYQAAIKYIKENVSKGERIYVGSMRHDQVFNNDIMFYFLSDRHSATKYHDLHPGITTTASIQEKIIEDMEMWRVKYIVLCYDSVKNANEINIKNGSKILDNFIRDNFTLDQKFGDYTIWKRQY